MVKSIYHLHPEKDWMNDPNGPAFFGGRFHMFFQHNPFGPVWGNMTWGHAVSPDMVRWQLQPNALHPDMWYDKDGVFSGCCVVKDGIPHIIYTGTSPETQCLAIGDADGRRFVKYAGNPILTKDAGDKRNGWRDPFVIKEPDGSYTLLIGSGAGGGVSDAGGVGGGVSDADNAGDGRIDGSGACGGADGAFVEQYASADLIHWTYKSRFCEFATLQIDKPSDSSPDCAGNDLLKTARNGSWNDTMWECPVVAQDDGGEAALFVSAIPDGAVHEITGRYNNGVFTPFYGRNADLGDALYAPNIVRHPDGRWILFGWMREAGPPEERAAQGWQGMLTLPRELYFINGFLHMRPAAEIKSLRGKQLICAENTNGLQILAGRHYEAEARISFGEKAGSAEMELLRDGNGNCVKLLLSRSGVYVGRSEEIAGGAPETVCGMSNALLIGDRCHVRAFVDGTAIEVYINSDRVITTRAYPHDGCAGLRVSADGGASIDRLEVYEMNDCYKNFMPDNNI